MSDDKKKPVNSLEALVGKLVAKASLTVKKPSEVLDKEKNK